MNGYWIVHIDIAISSWLRVGILFRSRTGSWPDFPGKKCPSRQSEGYIRGLAPGFFLIWVLKGRVHPRQIPTVEKGTSESRVRRHDSSNYDAHRGFRQTLPLRRDDDLHPNLWIEETKLQYLMMLFWIALWTGYHHLNLHVPCFFSSVFPTHEWHDRLWCSILAPFHQLTLAPWIFFRFSEDLPYHSACIFSLAMLLQPIEKAFKQ